MRLEHELEAYSLSEHEYSEPLSLKRGELRVPYRDNKLTQVMSDSLGGNAKTLMFVNTSPADYNADETQSSLVYASRVKLITNTAEKKSEGEEVHALNAIIKELVASGGSSALLDAQQSGGGGA